MNLKVLFIILIYWTIWLLIITVGVSDGSNIFINDGYNSSIVINSSGFSQSEIDTGFSFLSFLAVINSIFRFFGLALFGITPVLTGLSQIIFSAWASLFTMFTIGFIIDAIWNG